MGGRVPFRPDRSADRLAGLEYPQTTPRRREPVVRGSPTQEVLTGGTPVQDVFTAVISHAVLPGREREFVRWQEKITKAQERYPGFTGPELFKPVEGIEDHWVVAFRFDTRQHLDSWLESETREIIRRNGSAA